ncbi:MAG: hypothetical protein OXN86_04895 [Chloroflexota bacterium]|nr:hypothetical protein [Chloroflexota bacterium]MDE2891823.1 hypothetical protein [Chloroflexota bacterium]
MGAYDSPAAAYFAFLETFNARDAAGWAGVNSWPHARISAAASDSAVHWRPPTRVFTNAEEYLSAPLWDELEATGWTRSESSPSRIVQSSEIKAHIAGGWTRYDADGNPMASNRVVYVATRSEEGWGLQAQLKTDSFVDGRDYSATESEVLAAVESTLELLGDRDLDAYAEALGYPFTLIGPPGAVMQIASASEMAAAMRAVGDDQLDVPPGSVEIVNCGESGANLTFRVERDGAVQEALALVGLRDGVWRMLAISGI